MALITVDTRNIHPTVLKALAQSNPSAATPYAAQPMTVNDRNALPTSPDAGVFPGLNDPSVHPGPVTTIPPNRGVPTNPTTGATLPGMLPIPPAPGTPGSQPTNPTTGATLPGQLPVGRSPTQGASPVVKPKLTRLAIPGSATGSIKGFGQGLAGAAGKKAAAPVAKVKPKPKGKGGGKGPPPITKPTKTQLPTKPTATATTTTTTATTTPVGTSKIAPAPKVGSFNDPDFWKNYAKVVGPAQAQVDKYTAQLSGVTPPDLSALRPEARKQAMQDIAVAVHAIQSTQRQDKLDAANQAQAIFAASRAGAQLLQAGAPAVQQVYRQAAQDQANFAGGFTGGLQTTEQAQAQAVANQVNAATGGSYAPGTTGGVNVQTMPAGTGNAQMLAMGDIPASNLAGEAARAYTEAHQYAPQQMIGYGTQLGAATSAAGLNAAAKLEPSIENQWARLPSLTTTYQNQAVNAANQGYNAKRNAIVAALTSANSGLSNALTRFYHGEDTYSANARQAAVLAEDAWKTHVAAQTSRYGVDVGARTSTHATDVAAGTALTRATLDWQKAVAGIRQGDYKNQISFDNATTNRINARTNYLAKAAALYKAQHPTSAAALNPKNVTDWVKSNINQQATTIHGGPNDGKPGIPTGIRQTNLLKAAQDLIDTWGNFFPGPDEATRLDMAMRYLVNAQISPPIVTPMNGPPVKAIPFWKQYQTIQAQQQAAAIGKKFGLG
jgi:hypothetical protein